MKLKKEINALTKKADSVEFPQPVVSSWEHFLSDLKKVVDENIGYSAARGLTWDPYEQKFFFDLSEAADLGDFRCHIRYTFELDPRKDIMSELERLQGEIARWKSTIGNAAALLYHEQVKAAVEAKTDIPKTPLGLHLAEEK
jgi:hypothetical protein